MTFLGLGSNLPSKYGDSFANINLAISSLEAYGIKVIKKSSFYKTPSYPNRENPKFINVVILVETNLLPIDLMSVLIFIEEKLERKRVKKNDPRTCDIDIIDYNSQILNLKYNNLFLKGSKIGSTSKAGSTKHGAPHPGAWRSRSTYAHNHL